MAIAVTDTRLLEGLSSAVQSVKGLDLSGNADAIRDIAVQLLQENLDALKAAVAKEDKEEVEALEADLKLSDHRSTVDEAFSRLYLALHSGVLARRLAGDGDTDVEDLSHYLNSQSPSSFAASGLDRAIAGLERARGYADKYVPDAVRDDVNGFVDAAIEKAREAKDKATSEKAGAVQALSELEQVREAARERYLSARDLVSAALREAKQHDKLAQVMPGLTDVLSPRAASPAASDGDGAG